MRHLQAVPKGGTFSQVKRARAFLGTVPVFCDRRPISRSTDGKKMRIKKWLILFAILAATYPLLYVGGRASHVLVRTLPNSDPKYSNLIIPGRGFISFFLGETSWYVFYPAHKTEAWYRNRPEYRFRYHSKKRVEQTVHGDGEPAPQP